MEAARRMLLGTRGLPLAWTLRAYDRAVLPRDVVAGLTVAALIVPLSIGYAQVAGLPPEVGLYASLAPLVMYALLGSSRRLIIGPDAATAALVGATIAPLAVAADERTALAAGLGLLVGLIFVAMRLASLGFLANLLSKPILVGYLAGVGINVAIGQIPKILGDTPVEDLLDVVGGVGTVLRPGVILEAFALTIRDTDLNAPSIILGVLVILAMLLGGRLLPRVPMALLTLIGALAASYALDLQALGVQVLGPVQGGFPPVGVPSLSVDQALVLLPGALGLALLSFADTAATGRSFSEKDGEETDPDRELVALAGADLAGSLISGYPISASPSRTGASEAAGSRTQLTGLVAAATVLAVLLFLTGPMAYLPTPALAAVILISAIRFIDLVGIRDALPASGERRTHRQCRPARRARLRHARRRRDRRPPGHAQCLPPGGLAADHGARPGHWDDALRQPRAVDRRRPGRGRRRPALFRGPLLRQCGRSPRPGPPSSSQRDRTRGLSSLTCARSPTSTSPRSRSWPSWSSGSTGAASR